MLFAVCWYTCTHTAVCCRLSYMHTHTHAHTHTHTHTQSGAMTAIQVGYSISDVVAKPVLGLMVLVTL
jgi:hypothetical protein